MFKIFRLYRFFLYVFNSLIYLTYLNFNISPDNENNKNKLLNGGVYEGFKASAKLAASSSKMKDTLKHGKFNALKSGYQGVANRAERAKDFAPWLYGLIYSIAITILIFIIIINIIFNNLTFFIYFLRSSERRFVKVSDSPSRSVSCISIQLFVFFSFSVKRELR